MSDQPSKPKRTLSEDDVKVERVKTERITTAIKGTPQGGRPDDPHRRGATPATDHDA